MKKLNFLKTKTINLIIGLFLIAFTAQAQTAYTYIGREGNFLNPNNWENGAVPSSTISQNETVIIQGNAISQGNLTITINGTFMIENGGRFVNLGTIIMPWTGSFTNSGTFINNNNSTFNSSGTFINNGITPLSNSSPNPEDGSIVNRGTITVALAGVFINSGSFINDNIINIDEQIRNKGSFVNNGELNIPTRASLSNTGRFTTNSVINNSGTIYNNSGLVNPFIEDHINGFHANANINNIGSIINDSDGAFYLNKALTNRSVLTNKGYFMMNDGLRKPDESTITNKPNATITSESYFIASTIICEGGSMFTNKANLIMGHLITVEVTVK